MKSNLIAIVMAWAILCPAGKSDTTLMQDPRTVIAIIKDAALTGPVVGKVAVSSAVAQAALAQLLDSAGATTISKVFPDFNPADTISVDRHGETVRLINLAEYYSIEFADSVLWTDLAAAIGADASVKIVGQKAYSNPCGLVPNDPWFPLQYHLRSAMAGAQNFDSAWTYSTGDASIKLCVIDGGVRYDHVDLVGRIVAGYNGVDQSTNIGLLNPNDGHGTLVTGLIGAETNNAAFVSSANWYSPLLYGMAGEYGSELRIDEVAAGRCLDWARGQGASVANMSFGSYDVLNGFPTNNALAAAAYNAWQSDIILFAGKGNDSSATPFYPADLPTVVGIGACNADAVKEGYSNFGSGVDLLAYGHFPVSTSRDGDVGSAKGTSMASPIAAGVASLLMSYKPDLTADEVEQIMELTAINPMGYGWNDQYGWGIVKADAALDFVAKNSFVRKEAAGGTRQIVQGQPQHYFGNSGGLATGNYFVETYSVRNHFDFPEYNFSVAPKILIRHRLSSGWDAANPNDEVANSQVVPGTLTTTGCDVETYAYFIRYDILGRAVNKWWPCDNPPCDNGPDIRFKITVAGKPHVAAATSFTVVPLVVDAMSEGRYQAVRLQWTDPNSFESGWVIQRKVPDSATWQTLDTLEAVVGDARSYYDSTFVGSETYTYRVWPLPVDETPQYSPEVTITAEPRWPRAFTGGPVMAPSCFSIPAGKVVAAKTYSEAPPDTLEEGECATNMVRLYWSTPDRQKAGNLSYQVRQLDMHGPYAFEYHTTTSRQLELCRLAYYRYYRFEIEVTDAGGRKSDWSDAVVWALTGPVDWCPDPDYTPPYKLSDTAIQTDLAGCYPNPFNATTVISYSLEAPGPVTLRIFNLLGQCVRTMDRGYESAGSHSVIWDGTDDAATGVASGVYFVRFETPGYAASKKIVMLK